MPRSGPLLITADLPRDVFAWADALRRAHYPPERNRIPAHVTLFHGLPPSAGAEIAACLADIAATNPPPPARIDGLLNYDTGTALRVISAVLSAHRAEMADRFHGMLSAQDVHDPVLHITLQNKVPGAEAKALQARLAAELKPCKFGFPGLALHRYRDGLWELMQHWRYRGAKGG